jgi:cell division protein ZapE
MLSFNDIFKNYALQNDLHPDPVQDNAVDHLSQLNDKLNTPQKKSWFSQAKTIKGIYMWGGVGRGKTMMMDLFFDHIPIDAKKRVHFNVFMLDVHNSITLLRKDGKGQNPLQTIAKDIADTVRVLCFDEFQVYDIADAMVLSELFTHLFNHGVTVIATSNVAPDDLYKDGLQRSRFLPFIPLIKKHMDIVHIDSDTDYRQQALRDDGVYFVQNQARMNDLFLKLTSHDTVRPNHIDVKGRTLPIEKATVDTAWVSFSELCEKPRAAVDYQALAKNYKTVFINDVPRMGYDRRNEAKRFILLIDTLYDEQIRVIINAETTPIEIYNGGDHAFEFERTISRLLEMQGQEYQDRISTAQDIDD